MPGAHRILGRQMLIAVMTIHNLADILILPDFQRVEFTVAEHLQQMDSRKRRLEDDHIPDLILSSKGLFLPAHRFLGYPR